MVTQDAPVYIAPFLDDLFGRLRGQVVVAGVVCLSSTTGKSLLEEARQRFALYGPIAFLRMSWLVVRNRMFGRLEALWPRLGCHTVESALRRHDIARIACTKVNDPRFRAKLCEEGIDVVLSIASPQIFRRALLEAPSRGCLNYHMGLLPRYRGRLPLFWAMFHDEKEVGLSVHEMNAGIDDGPILVQRRLPLGQADSLDDLYRKCIAVGPELVVEALEKVADGDTDRIPNNAEEASYFRFPDREEARSFRARGKRFF